MVAVLIKLDHIQYVFKFQVFNYFFKSRFANSTLTPPQMQSSSLKKMSNVVLNNSGGTGSQI